MKNYIPILKQDVISVEKSISSYNENSAERITKEAIRNLVLITRHLRNSGFNELAIKYENYYLNK